MELFLKLVLACCATIFGAVTTRIYLRIRANRREWRRRRALGIHPDSEYIIGVGWRRPSDQITPADWRKMGWDLPPEGDVPPEPGARLAEQVIAEMRKKAMRQFGDASRWPEVR